MLTMNTWDRLYLYSKPQRYYRKRRKLFTKTDTPSLCESCGNYQCKLKHKQVTILSCNNYKPIYKVVSKL